MDIEVMADEYEDLRNGLLGYIDACNQNLIQYRAMGDHRAVEAAEGMIAEFQMCLQQLESAGV